MPRKIWEDFPMVTMIEADDEQAGRDRKFVFCATMAAAVVIALLAVLLFPPLDPPMCSPADLRVGMFRAEVMARCGTPKGTLVSRSSDDPTGQERVMFRDDLIVVFEGNRLRRWSQEHFHAR